MEIAINDEITKRGMMILRDFIKDITVTRRNKTAMQQFVDLATKGYFLIYGVDVINNTNIIDVWNKYRNLLMAWFDVFTEKYGMNMVNAALNDLPHDYATRVSLLTLMLLARDLIEARDYTLDNEHREIVDTIVINGTNVTLHDIVKFIYSVALWSGTNEALSIASIFSRDANAKGLLDNRKLHVVVYAPLLAAGIVSEDFIHMLANYIAEKKTTKDYRVTTTGLGQAFMKYAAFVPRHSLDTSYYHTAITTFVAISHVHYNVLNYIINNILNTSIHGNIDYMMHEYSNYANYINVIDAFPNFFTQAYTRGDALRDLAAMTFTLINARLDLLNKDQELHVRLLSKYTFLMKSPNDLIRDAVRVMLHVSGAVM
jgi:hypothetical protein